MRKKSLIIFFFITYSLMSFHSFAETPNDRKSKKDSIEIEFEEAKPEDAKNEIDMDDLIDKFGPIKEYEKVYEKNRNGRVSDSDLDCTKNIHYTLAQKQRLDQIYHRIYMDYLALIETYAWAGALTQDQKLIRYKMLKNYVLTFPKRNYKWCSEYEEDEWEEEWFNSDND